jgi:hypothetical protein
MIVSFIIAAPLFTIVHSQSPAAIGAVPGSREAGTLQEAGSPLGFPKGDAVLNILWPTNPKADPSVLCRLGRVLHWIATALAVLLACLVLQITITEPGNDYGYLIILVIGGVIYLAGRASRYILGGE